MKDFVNEPHAAVASDARADSVLNMWPRNRPGPFGVNGFRSTGAAARDKEIARAITLALAVAALVDIMKDVNPAHSVGSALYVRGEPA